MNNSNYLGKFLIICTKTNYNNKNKNKNNNESYEQRTSTKRIGNCKETIAR